MKHLFSAIYPVVEFAFDGRKALGFDPFITSLMDEYIATAKDSPFKVGGVVTVGFSNKFLDFLLERTGLAYYSEEKTGYFEGIHSFLILDEEKYMWAKLQYS